MLNKSRIIGNYCELSSIADGGHDLQQFNQSKTFPHTKKTEIYNFHAQLNKYLLLVNGIQKCTPYIQRDGILKERQTQKQTILIQCD